MDRNSDHIRFGRLGTGGMGEVYRARDTKLHRDVAIKTLLVTADDAPERLARFSREAQLLASLNHPPIAVLNWHEELKRLVPTSPQED